VRVEEAGITKEKKSFPIRVGISACLLGQELRYDAGHKRDCYLTNILADYFQFVPICPEVEVGMGVPRESVCLTGAPEKPRMIGNITGQDWTERMQAYAGKRRRELSKEFLSG